MRRGWAAAAVVGAACGQALAQTAPLQIDLPPVEVVGASPLIGIGIDHNSVPAATHALNPEDLRRQGTANLANVGPAECRRRRSQRPERRRPVRHT